MDNRNRIPLEINFIANCTFLKRAKCRFRAFGDMSVFYDEFSKPTLLNIFSLM